MIASRTRVALRTARGASLLLLAVVRDVAHADEEVTEYLTRHAEKMNERVVPSDVQFMDICSSDREDCAETLDPIGEQRAMLLADYFEEKGIASELTHVFPSHKQRTRQTVEESAARAGLSDDMDLMSGDGVQQLPDDVKDEFSGISHSFQLTVDALLLLPSGSVARVGAHSGTIYR